MKKTMKIIGCVLWIAGLSGTVAGLNIDGNTGQWISIIGNILFLAGLMIIGAIWFMEKRREEKQ